MTQPSRSLLPLRAIRATPCAPKGIPTIDSLSCAANSPLLNCVVFRQNGTVRMTTTKSYDRLNRLQTISSVGATTLASPAFDYDTRSQSQLEPTEFLVELLECSTDRAKNIHETKTSFNLVNSCRHSVGLRCERALRKFMESL